MVRVWELSLGCVFASAAFLVSSCGGGGEITAPATGSIEVTTATSGPSPDPNGYAMIVDGSNRGTIEVSGAARLDGLTAGSHSVGLGDIAANCHAGGDNPRTVTVTAGTSATAAFEVACSALPPPPPPTVGSVTVIADVEPRAPGVPLDLPIGMTFHVRAVVRDPAGTELTDREVSWSSSSPNVATVDAAGLVTGVAQGNARIIATSEGTQGHVSVAVRPLFGRAVPGPVSGGYSFRSISANGSFTCALAVAGPTYCWGGAKTTAPTLLDGGGAFVSLSSGGGWNGSHLCALTAAGKAFCWGENGSGQLGDGSVVSSARPVEVAGNFTFRSLAAAQTHTCGLISTGAAYCWGDNFAGELGTGDLVSSSTPVAVTGGHVFVTLGAGNDHTCALTAAGKAYCWGENNDGELGDGSGQNKLSPVAVDGGLSFTKLAVAGEHVCALTSTGEVHCWGWDNIGPYLPGVPDRSIPVLVSGDRRFTALTAGGAHDCAITAAGAAYCWGQDFFGQLGDGGGFDRLTPAPVLGDLAFAALTAGLDHTCGLLGSGAAYCWGHNENGELGDGSP